MASAKYLHSISLEALDKLQIVGENIRLSRRARGWSLAEASGRFLMSKATLQNIENGDPSTGIGAYIAALDVMGLTGGLEQLGGSHLDPIVRNQ